MLRLLREIKWVLYSVKLVALYVVGRTLRLTWRQTTSIVLTGETNYTGGTFVYFRELLDLLLEQGFAPVIVIHRANYERELRRLAAQRGVCFQVVPSACDTISQLIFLYRVIARRPCLLVSSSGAPSDYTLSLLYGLPTIHIFHSAPVGPIDRRKRRLFRWFFRPPHRIITVSEQARSAIMRHFGVPRRARDLVSHVYNGVPDLWEHRASSPPGQHLVVTIGHVIGYKDPDTWLKTARYVIQHSSVPVSFIWIGDGPELAHYKAATAETAQIRFVGFKRDAAEILAQAAVYYQPSRIESFGLAVAEALSMGVPCVVSDSGGLPEVVDHERSGFLCPAGNSVSHGQAILRLLNNSDLRNRMSAEAREQYLSRFTLDRWKNDVMHMIRSGVTAR